MDDKIKWCFAQKNVALVEPNVLLMDAYLQKSENALKVMRNSGGNPEWEIAGAYYAMYFSVYALFMKVGIKSEIHSCTLEIFRRFFREYFSDSDFAWFETAKKLREIAQYYAFNLDELKGYPEMIQECVLFCSKCLSTIDVLDAMSIKRNLGNSV